MSCWIDFQLLCWAFKCFLSSYTFPNLGIQWYLLVWLPENSPVVLSKAGDWRLLCLYRGLAPLRLVRNGQWRSCPRPLRLFFLHLYLYEACPLLWAERGPALLLQLVSSLRLSPMDQNHSTVFCLQIMGLLGQGPRLHLSEGPDLCPLHRLNRRVHSRKVLFHPRSHPFVLSLNPLSIIKVRILSINWGGFTFFWIDAST